MSEPISIEEAEVAANILASNPDITIEEIAASWDTSVRHLKRVMRANGFAAPKQAVKGFTPDQHVRAQQRSGIPPDLYAARAGLNTRSLQHYAYQLRVPLAMSSYRAKAQWWADRLDTLEPKRLQGFLIHHDLPLKLVAYWWHKLYGTREPVQTLVWGFPQLMVCEADQFNDVRRFHNPHTETHFLGRGKTVVSIDIRLATEIQRHSRALR